VPATGHGQPNQEKNDCSGTHYVRNHGYRASQIARVRPDQADDRSQDDQGDGRGQPVEDPSCGDEAILQPAFWSMARTSEASRIAARSDRWSPT
jgi:hypothetical protein